MAADEELKQARDEAAKHYAEAKRLLHEVEELRRNHNVLVGHLDDIRMLMRIATER